MDGGQGPFRSSQPADRRVASRPEPVRRQPEEPQPAAEPATTHRVAQAHDSTKNKKSSKKRPLFPFIAIIIVIIIAILGWSVWSSAQNGNTAIDGGKYQAVFFTNGQVYFGKLKPLNNEYLQLTDIYYLQTQAASEAGSEELQKTSNDQSNVQLIKLGEEIHGPEDKMVISKDQVLFYENLKTDSKVAKSIEQYKSAN